MKEVKIIFDNDEAAKHFLSWLSGSGEQSYWDWMSVREQEEKGPITALRFDYWGGTKDGAEFGKHPVATKCGRVDEK